MFIDIANAATSSSIFSNNMELWEFILLAISLFVLFAGIFSIVFVLWWGLLLVLSGGKDEKIKPAINTIRYAIIGIVVTVITIFVFPILWGLLGLDVERFAEPSRIFEKIEDIWDKIFGNNSYQWSPTIDNIDDFPANFSDL